jgi:predicted GIY-YIG superfamily endonuclease
VTEWFVYGLRDPRDGVIYYVGSSCRPHARAKQHASQRTCSAYERTRELWKLGTPCEVVILSVHDYQVRAWSAECVEIMTRPNLVNKLRSKWWIWEPTESASAVGR